MSGDTYRIGSGAGFAGDRRDAAELLAREGELDAIVFECLAERTIGLAQRRLLTGGVGFDVRMVERIAGVASAMLARGGVMVSNGGAADPRGAAAAVRARLSNDHPDVAVAAVWGDDVLDRLDGSSRVDGTDLSIADLSDRIVSANAYLGADGILDALRAEADVIVTGRVSDAALFLGPLAHRFGWAQDDWEQLAHGILVGHLLECAGQLTGGYFADGGMKSVPGLSRLGFPFADVAGDGSAEYGKVAGTGGRLDRSTLLEQLLYEIDDPTAYLTPDATVDLSRVQVDEIGLDRVGVSGAHATGRPDQLKVSVGVRDGFAAIASINYGGYAAIDRAHLAADVIRERWADLFGHDDPVRVDFVGCNALTPWSAPHASPEEVQVRFSVRTLEAGVARDLVEEVEALYTNGPAGGGGTTGAITESIGIVSTFIDRADVEPVMEVVR